MPTKELPSVFCKSFGTIDNVVNVDPLNVGVGHHLVPYRTAKEFVDRLVNGFTLDVPESNVNRRNGTGINSVGREESRTEHLLPNAL